MRGDNLRQSSRRWQHGGGSDVGGGGGGGGRLSRPSLLLGRGRSAGVRVAARAATVTGVGAGGPWGIGTAAIGGSSSGCRHPQQRRGRRIRRREQQPSGWALFQAGNDLGSGAGSSADGEGSGGVDLGSGGLLFGAPEGAEGDSPEDEEVTEVNEEDLREEWIARGLDPHAFDPFTLLQMWENEDQEVRKSLFSFLQCSTWHTCAWGAHAPLARPEVRTASMLGHRAVRALDTPSAQMVPRPSISVLLLRYASSITTATVYPNWRPR